MTVMAGGTRIAGARTFHVEWLGGERVWAWFGGLLVMTAALLTVRLVALSYNATDVFFDEAQYWFWGQDFAFGYFSKPPLIGWIIGATTQVCGDTAFCLRLASPILHGLTALGVFAVGHVLYGPRVGFWSGLVYATLPAVWLSSGIISTDVPLLTCWAVALAAFAMLIKHPPTVTGRLWWPAILLGVALGVGLNAKYAMAYFVLCALIYGLAVPQQRWFLREPRFWTAIVIALVLIAPNIVWNLQNGFATVSHTAANAKWSGSLGNPAKALEFFGAQFGVFGPILFAGLLIICWRAWRDGLRDADALLLSFAIPVILIVTVQAFISRAHANWAAVSYVAAPVLVTATMIRDADWHWLRASLGLHVLLGAGLIAATTWAGTFQLPNGTDPFARTLGWRKTADFVAAMVASETSAGRAPATILTENRAMAAELIYYMRGSAIPITIWRGGRAPQNHYELVVPYAPTKREPVLFVTRGSELPEGLAARFSIVQALGRRQVQPGLGQPRMVHFFHLSGFKGL